LATMPTTALKQVAQIVGGDVDVYTDKALWIHEYQYNGPDPKPSSAHTQTTRPRLGT